MKIKRLISAVLVAAFTAAMCGCSGGKAPSGEEKPVVIATIFPAYDFARQVFGDTADVRMLLKPGQESHSYDPSAKDIVEINGCDLFVYNGGESDQWVESILSSTPDINTFRMTEAVTLLDEEYSEGMQGAESDHDHDHGDHDEEYDEHVWTSPENAAAIVRKLGETAAQLFPEDSQLISGNAESYAAEIDKLDESFSKLFEGESRNFIFGDRFPLLYFFRHYGLSYYAAFPGCGSETEPSARTMAFLLDKLGQEDSVPAVFCIELSSKRLAEVLAEDSGLPVAEFHSCHNISADDLDAGESYLTLMRRNLDTLTEILRGE